MGPNQELSDIEKSEAQIRTAMKDPQKLVEWLEASGRRWVVFNAMDLVKALPWPTGVELFMQVIQAYRDFRSTKETGRTENLTVGPQAHEVPVYYGETLEVEELDRCIRYLVGQITDKDPSWSLSKDPQ